MSQKTLEIIIVIICLGYLIYLGRKNLKEKKK
jgi:hypothetical protein